MNWLTKLLRSFLKSLTTPSQPPELSEGQPITYTQTQYDTPTATINIWASKQLRSRNGYWPEQKAAKVIVGALDNASINHKVTWGFSQTFDPPTEDVHANGYESVHWFADQNTPDTDANLLLTDYPSAGVTWNGHCVAAGRKLTRNTSVVKYAVGSDVGNLQAAPHEVGHALGVPGDASKDPGTQTYGKSWSEDGKWHRTLMVSTPEGGVNVCGNELSAKGEQTPVYHLTFSDCAKEKILETLKQS